MVRTRMVIGTGLMVLGAVLFLLAAYMGQARLYLVLIVPVVTVEGPLGVVSLALVMAGALVMTLGSLRYRTVPGLDIKSDGSWDGRAPKVQGRPKGRRSVEGGGVIFIGPFPIVFGSKGFRDGLPPWWALLSIGLFIFIVLIVTIACLMVLGRSVG